MNSDKKEKLKYFVIILVCFSIICMMTSSIISDYTRFNYINYNSNYKIVIKDYKFQIVNEFMLKKYEYYVGASFLLFSIFILSQYLLKQFRELKND